MATWNHPAIAYLQALAKAAAQPRRQATVALPLLPRYRVHVLKPKQGAPQGELPHRQAEAPDEAAHSAQYREPLSAGEIAARLRRLSLRHNEDRSRRVPLLRLAALADVGKSTIYRLMQGDDINEETRSRLSTALAWIDDGKTQWRRVGQHWQTEHREPPNPLPFPQPRVVPATDYNEWASCRSCGSRRFSRFQADRTYWACDTCVSMPDRQMMGARPTIGTSRRK